ncbi:MAG: two-component system NtrC family sensor kinase [Chlamydiales bacterium]|jgi:two-component system NtrC family sensor kinase
MSLRSKIALVLLVTVSAVAGGDQALNFLHFAHRFRTLEVERAREQLQSIEQAVAAQIDDIDRAAAFSAAAISAGLPSGAKKIADREASILRGLPFDVILAYDSQGQVLFHKTAKPLTGANLALREMPNERLSPDSVLLRSGADGSPLCGIFNTSRGPLLLASREVGPPFSLRIAVGTLLDPERLTRLAQRGGVDAQIEWLTNRTATEEQNGIVMGVESHDGFYTDAGDHAPFHRAWAVMNGLSGAPALLLRVSAPRDHDALRSEFVRYDILTAVAMVLLFPLVVLFLLQRIVTGPLTKLTNHVLAIGESDETDARLGLERRDEIGDLAREFDRMLEQLGASRAEVVRTARLAGMSEISTGVLHNVGNVVNNVATSAHLSFRHLEKMTSLQDLRAILEELQAHAGDLDAYLDKDARGQHLMVFFSALIEQLDARVQATTEELFELSGGIEHISILLRSFEDTAGCMGVIENVDVGAQLNSVVELCSRALNITDIEIVRDYSDVPSLPVDRHRLLEVLMNLVRNALQALSDGDRTTRRLTLRIDRNEASHLCIEVDDNGAGIDQENLQRVFAAHYSTRPDGRGLGLHLAATAVMEMGGSLDVHSAGSGQGACFKLSLPLAAPSRRGSAATSPRLASARATM